MVTLYCIAKKGSIVDYLKTYMQYYKTLDGDAIPEIVQR